MSKIYPMLLVFLILLSSCSQNEKNLSRNPHTPNIEKMTYDPNETTNVNNQDTSDTNQVDDGTQSKENNENAPNENTGNENPEQHTTPVEHTDKETEHLNDLTIPNDTPQHEAEEPTNESTEQPKTNTQQQKAFPLFITDFKERWNAISDEQTGDVYIQQFQPPISADSNRYHATLKEKLIIELYTMENKQISRIKIINTGKSRDELLKMLTSWWQVLLITNPQSELHEIDTIFNKIGIGPNSNIEELLAVTLTFGGLHYQVTPTQNSIVLEAIYPDNHSLQEGT